MTSLRSSATPSPGDPGPGPASARRGPSPARTIHVAVVNDYELVVRPLVDKLVEASASLGDPVTIVERGTDDTLVTRVDVAIVDTFAGRRDAIAVAASMLDGGEAAHVVLHTQDASAELLDGARTIGVSAVVLTSVEGPRLVSLLAQVVAGERRGLEDVARASGSAPTHSLSGREREVLAMLALGATNRQIADELFLSVDTVKTYVRRVFRKLGVDNRTQAAIRAAEHGVAPPSARVDRLRSAPRPN